MIGLITAMPEESAPFTFEEASRTDVVGRTLRRGRIEGNEVLTVVSGIGTTNAAIAATLLIEHGCDTIIMSGAAGAISTHEIGDVIASSACVYHDVDATAFSYAPGQVPGELERFEADAQLLNAAFEAGASAGTIASGNAFVADPNRVAIIRETFNADVIDMESAAVAHVCTHARVRWMILRGVSDRADEEAKDSFEARLELAATNAAACSMRIIRSL